MSRALRDIPINTDPLARLSISDGKGLPRPSRLTSTLLGIVNTQTVFLKHQQLMNYWLRWRLYTSETKVHVLQHPKVIDSYSVPKYEMILI